MSKFTPGSWEANDAGDGTHTISSGSIDIADTRSASNEEANARLIAAAPELLKALVEVLPYAEKAVKHLEQQMVGSLYPAINQAMLDRAHVAIAKAKSE